MSWAESLITAPSRTGQVHPWPSCGAEKAALVETGAGSPGQEIHLLVRVAGDKSLLDIIPAEEELAGLLGRPVFLIPEQSLHPDQARRLRASGRPI